MSVVTLSVRFFAGMSGIEQDGRVAANLHNLQFSSSSREEDEEDEEEEEHGGPTEEEWCAKMQTFLPRAPTSLGSLLNREKQGITGAAYDNLFGMSHDDKLMMPGQSSALFPAASNAAPAAHRSIPLTSPLLVQQGGTSSHINSLKQPLCTLETRLLPPLLPTFAAGPKADSDHRHAQRLDLRLHKLTDTQATLMSSLGQSFQK